MCRRTTAQQQQQLQQQEQHEQNSRTCVNRMALHGERSQHPNVRSCVTFCSCVFVCVCVCVCVFEYFTRMPPGSTLTKAADQLKVILGSAPDIWSRAICHDKPGANDMCKVRARCGMLCERNICMHGILRRAASASVGQMKVTLILVTYLTLPAFRCAFSGIPD